MNVSTVRVLASLAMISLLAACTAMSPASEQPTLNGTAWVLSVAARTGAGRRKQPDPALRGRACFRHRWLQSLHRTVHDDGLDARGRPQGGVDADGLPARDHEAGKRS